ncbi:Glia maturation factor beta [Lamellibrachia satsuma]|nr:Glia maturation factor beta [Lamellibrachia satsuma]
MAENVKVCELDAHCKELLKKFRFRKAKNNAAIVMKIDQGSRMILVDEEYEDCTLDELQDELPASQPRFLVYSCSLDHGDGRVSYPLSFIYVSPAGCKPEQQMMYAGSLKSLVDDAGFSKVFEVRSTEDLTEEWLLTKLKEFN